jgi:hypothetical protein
MTASLKLLIAFERDKIRCLRVSLTSDVQVALGTNTSVYHRLRHQAWRVQSGVKTPVKGIRL